MTFPSAMGWGSSLRPERRPSPAFGSTLLPGMPHRRARPQDLLLPVMPPSIHLMALLTRSIWKGTSSATASAVVKIRPRGQTFGPPCTGSTSQTLFFDALGALWNLVLEVGEVLAAWTQVRVVTLLMGPIVVSAVPRLPRGLACWP